MPLFYQHTINEYTRLAIWQILEQESFFLAKVPLKKDVSHPHKRLQHLAGRYLLPALFEDFPLEEIVIADTRKPFLENEKYHFSISHCGDFAAAIVSSTHRVGVDIEIITPKIERIRHKFLEPGEYGLAIAGWPLAGSSEIENHSLQTMLWSAKEAIYKWYGEGLVDFKNHMHLHRAIEYNAGGWSKMDFIFDKNFPVPLQVLGRFFDQLVLAWVLS
ncbi:MAG TPA: 4'-phosphopantetheinyl transferase superfamily protein [Puia sp.]|nr:4'-phosphopantetheinyl transferase superfamily protein [Puia sp.]